MKNKAFTLVELLGVIVLLGILGVVIIPKVGDSITNSKETAYVTQEEQIKKAAYDFIVDNTNLFDNTNTITLKLGVLKQKGYLPINIKNPKTRKNISNESIITITKTNNAFEITLNLIDLIEVTEDIDNNSPIIVLNGNYVEYVNVNSNETEINETLVQNGAKAYTSSGEELTEITTQIKIGETEKTSIKTNTLETYQVTYTVTDNDKTTSATRTVIIRDNEAPQIAFQKETNLHVSEVEDFDLEKDLIINDNYDSNPTIQINSSLANRPGNYVITYTVTDASRNQTTERRVININDDWSKYYTNVEYIESTGTQYIDTGYYWQHEIIEIDFDGIVTSNSSAQSLFGNEEYTTSSKTARNFSGIPYGINGRYDIHIGNANHGFVSTTVGTRFNLKIQTTTDNNLKVYKDNVLTIDKTYSGTVMAKQNSYNTAASTVGNIFIFANHNTLRSETPETSIQNIGGMKLYSFKMYDNNVLVRNFIPSVRNSDGVAGLYDLVNNKFYTNSGTGNFQYKMLNENPYERLYTKLEYIESTGTQYIDTGIIPNQDTGFDIDFLTHDKASSTEGEYASIFGSRQSLGLGYQLSTWSTGSLNGHILFGKNNDSPSSIRYNAGIIPETRQQIKLKNGTLTLPDNTTTILTNYEFELPSAIIIFAFGNNNNIYEKANTKLYKLKFYDKNTLIRNFVPAVRNSDGVVGLYDEVNDVFYTNSGEGEFIKGEL